MKPCCFPNRSLPLAFTEQIFRHNYDAFAFPLHENTWLVVENLQLTKNSIHCVKSVQIRSLSGPHFPVFGLNTEIYGPEKTPYLGTFHVVIVLNGEKP